MSVIMFTGEATAATYSSVRVGSCRCNASQTLACTGTTNHHGRGHYGRREVHLEQSHQLIGHGCDHDQRYGRGKLPTKRGQSKQPSDKFMPSPRRADEGHELTSLVAGVSSSTAGAGGRGWLPGRSFLHIALNSAGGVLVDRLYWRLWRVRVSIVVTCRGGPRESVFQILHDHAHPSLAGSSRPGEAKLSYRGGRKDSAANCPVSHWRTSFKRLSQCRSSRFAQCQSGLLR
jgi:hypothetical protein